VKGKQFMELSILFFLRFRFLFVFGPFALAQAEEKRAFVVPYGVNDKVGKFAEVNGVKMYYEIYGEGEPLLIIHGNSGSIGGMSKQIAHFSKTHQVIVADSRGHGKSGLGEAKLTYRQMADDYEKLLAHLKVTSAHVLGYSDGGIIGLLLGIHHRECVSKIAVMGANLNPGTDAVYSWAPQSVRKRLKLVQGRIDEGDTFRDWKRIKQVLRLLVEQPNIELKELRTIKSPVLVLSADRDIIREEHTVSIFQNIPKAHLCIFPGSTHFIGKQNPELFNLTVEQFLTKPFERPESKALISGGK